MPAKRKRMSPESRFIRTGKIPLDLDPSRAKNLGARFLSKTWHDEATKREKQGKGLDLPLPTMRQRIHGGRLTESELGEINRQVDFATDIFTKHLSPAKRRTVKRQARELVSKTTLSITSALNATGRDLTHMRAEGLELYSLLKRKGRGNMGIVNSDTSKFYLAKGWTTHPERSAAVHETIHVLCNLGVIKVEAPTASMADRLYALEQDFLKINLKLSEPALWEFDRQPAMKVISARIIAEPQWSYALGNKMGQWVFTHFSESEARWEYVRLRCMGKTHKETLAEIRKQGFRIK